MSTFKEHKTTADRSASDRTRHKKKIEKAIREGVHNIVSDESIIGQDGKKNKSLMNHLPVLILYCNVAFSGYVILQTDFFLEDKYFQFLFSRQDKHHHHVFIKPGERDCR